MIRWVLPIAASLIAVVACHEPIPSAPLSSTGPALPSMGIRFSGRISSDQPHATGRDDLDGDGAADCWQSHWEGGSGAGGIILELRAPCANPPLIVDTTSSFDAFLSEVELPPALAGRPRLVEGVVDLLFGRAHLRRIETIDGSFRWLIEHLRSTPGPAVEPFAATARYTPRWSPGTPALPPSQVLILSGGTAPNRAHALLAYFAHNHGELSPAASCGSRSVLMTRHGVVVHDRDRDASSWIYLSTAGAKLRRPSVGRVNCLGELIVIEHGQDGQDELVVTSPGTGRYGQIPLEAGYQLDARNLTVGGSTYSAEDLTEALRKSSSP